MTPASDPSALPELTPPGSRTSPAAGARGALILLLAINLFNYVDRSILYSVADTVRVEFRTTNAAIGWLTTAFLITYMVLSPLFGWLADRYSRWVLIGIGVVLWSLASGGTGLAKAYAVMLATRCLIGVGEAAYGPVAPTIIADLYPVNVRGKVLSWFYAAIPVGFAMGYALGGPFAHPGKWHYAFLLTVPPGLILGTWCFFMREPARGGAEGIDRPPAAPLAPQRPTTAGDYLVLLRIPSYVLNNAAMTAMTFAIGGVAAWMPTYLTTDKGMSPEVANLAFGAIVAAAGLTATLAGGIAGDKLRTRFSGSYFLVSAAGALAGFPLFLLILVTPFPLAWVVMFAAVFCLFFNTGPANTALANVSPPAIRASAFAVNIFIIHTLGDAISPPIIGWVRDHSRYGLSAGFVVVSGTMVLGGLLWLWAARYLAHDTLRAPSLMEDPARRPPVPIAPAPTGPSAGE